MDVVCYAPSVQLPVKDVKKKQACIAANKTAGVHAALITASFSAHRGVEDDNMNVMCLGGRITGPVSLGIGADIS